MKKIFAILVGLVLLGSVFGIASAMAGVCELPSFTTVHVGETFKLQNNNEPCTYWEDYLEVTYLGDGVYQFKAISPGKVTFNCGGCGSATATVTILPKEYPMHWFMKMLGLGKKK